MNLDFGSPEVARVRWLDPVQLFERVRLPAMISQIMQNRTLTFKNKAKSRKKNEK